MFWYLRAQKYGSTAKLNVTDRESGVLTAHRHQLTPRKALSTLQRRSLEGEKAHQIFKVQDDLREGASRGVALYLRKGRQRDP